MRQYFTSLFQIKWKVGQCSAVKSLKLGRPFSSRKTTKPQGKGQTLQKSRSILSSQPWDRFQNWIPTNWNKTYFQLQWLMRVVQNQYGGNRSVVSWNILLPLTWPTFQVAEETFFGYDFFGTLQVVSRAARFQKSIYMAYHFFKSCHVATYRIIWSCMERWRITKQKCSKSILFLLYWNVKYQHPCHPRLYCKKPLTLCWMLVSCTVNLDVCCSGFAK